MAAVYSNGGMGDENRVNELRWSRADEFSLCIAEFEFCNKFMRMHTTFSSKLASNRYVLQSVLKV